MPGPFLLLSVFLLLVAALLLFVVLQRQRSASCVSLERVWQEWPFGGDEDERARRERLLAETRPQHRDAVYNDLKVLETRIRSESEPLKVLRGEIMDAVERRLINREILALPAQARHRLRAESNDVLASDAEAQAYLAANELRLEVLREYAARRHGDRAPGDWFEVYEHAAGLRRRGVRDYLLRALSGDQVAAAEDRQQAMNLVDAELRRRLLEVPPGTRFPGLAVR